ncbi:LPXTG cell wall anchor domain-containing protein [Streptococcus dysgalactiae subsp. dysgalactiae]|nr:LPXTG cell wall anchor domain-containing protein [Streptococcus dysgalactiae subsp. dysgalactiae]
MNHNFKKVVATSTILSALLIAPSVLADEATQPTITNATTITATDANTQSYAEKTYSNYGETTSTPVTDANKNADVDKDGQITTINEKNGYVVHTETTVEENVPLEEDPDSECTGTKTTTTVTNEVELNAKSIMDTNLDDYSNNGYIEKVKNPNNHPKAYTNTKATTENSGPANLEVQHWQNGSNTNTTVQNWRIVFGSDYAINNTILTVTLPYSDVTTSDATDWLVDKYYKLVTNDNNIYTNKLIPKSITFNGNIATIDLGDIPAGSAYSIIFTKKFTTPQDFSNDLKVTSAKISGTWNTELITSDSKYIKTSKSTPEVTWSDQVCPIPTNPTDPTNPTVPTDPTVPVKPISNIKSVNYVKQLSSLNKNTSNTLPTTGDSKTNIFSIIGLLFMSTLLFIKQIVKKNN